MQETEHQYKVITCDRAVHTIRRLYYAHIRSNLLLSTAAVCPTTFPTVLCFHFEVAGLQHRTRPAACGRDSYSFRLFGKCLFLPDSTKLPRENMNRSLVANAVV